MGTASFRIVVVAKGGSEWEISTDDWRNDLIDEAIVLVWGHELAREHVAVEHDQVRMLFVKDRIHNADTLPVVLLAIGFAVQ